MLASSARLRLVLGLVLVLSAHLVSSSAEGPDLEALRAKARAAYDQGRCEVVLATYNEVGMRDGLLIEGVDNYRIGFCIAYLNRGDPTSYYEAAARELAEATTAPSAGLMSYFYQVNALLNLHRNEEATLAARRAIERFEAGQLVVPEDEAESWFRLGKLFRDAGDPKGALVPFDQALDAAEKGHMIRAPYLERIARGAGDAGDAKLARRAGALLAASSSGDRDASLRLGRVMLSAGDLSSAKTAFGAAAKARGEAGLAGQYSLRIVNRVEELEHWQIPLLETLPDGRALSALAPTDLQEELAKAAQVAFLAMQGRAAEAPRKNKPGTRPVPLPETTRAMHDAQQVFASLARIAIQRGYPIREWAIGGGYTPLLYHPWRRIFVNHIRQQRQDQLIKVVED